MTDLAHMIGKQLALQAEKMKDGDPRRLEGDARRDFLRWNAFALEDEIHEAMQEVAWKPWASKEFINRQEFVMEMVDAFHFFMNMLLAVSPGMSPEQIAEEFTKLYFEKNSINAKRQDEGYSGDKCPHCGREVEHAEVLMKYPNYTIYECSCKKTYTIPPKKRT